MDNQTAINRISEFLKPERVRHSIAVAEICKTLARFHKIDAQKAWEAGIYHDIAKNFDTSTMIEYAGTDAPNSYVNTKTMHGIASANYIKRKFGISDKTILDAITYHVIPNKRPSALTKIIYIADKLEPNKTYIKNASELLEKAKKDLNGTFKIVLNDMKYIEEQKNSNISI